MRTLHDIDRDLKAKQEQRAALPEGTPNSYEKLTGEIEDLLEERSALVFEQTLQGR